MVTSPQAYTADMDFQRLDRMVQEMRLPGAGAEAGSDRNMFILRLLAVGTRLGAAARSLNQ